MSKQALIKRLSTYYPMERMHAFLTFPGIIIYFLYHYPLNDVVLIIYGLLVCIFILIQGQQYWKLKLYRLTKRPVNQKKQLQLFQKAKRINTLLIAGMPLVLLLQLYLSGWTVPQNNLLIGAACTNLFAILEHINYYHVQLMVDNTADWQYIRRNKRLKTASLSKDLKEQQF